MTSSQMELNEIKEKIRHYLDSSRQTPLVVDVADVSEMIGYPAFKDTLIQIFGHSQLKETGTFLHREN